MNAGDRGMVGMSEKRRQQLSEEALERIEWEELGFGSCSGSGLVDGRKRTSPTKVYRCTFFALSYCRAFEALWDEVWSGPEELDIRCSSSRVTAWSFG